MIRMGLFLYLILITIQSGLLLTGDINAFGAFADLSSALNQFQGVGADSDITGLNPTTELGAPTDVIDFAGFISALATSGIAALKIFAFLMAGSVEIIEVIDPSASWGLIILAPIATLQVFIFMALLIRLTGALRLLIPL